jgi:ribonuclease R
METERAANKYKQVEFMQQYVGEDFDAVISGVASFGFWAETVDTKCEGMVSVIDLADFDDFEYKEGEYALVGHSSGFRFAMGDKVRVRVVSANLAKRQVDFSILDLPLSPGGRRKSDFAFSRPVSRSYNNGGRSQPGKPKEKKDKKAKNTNRKKK